MTVFIYLYRLAGDPQYIGQAVDVKRRDDRHCKRQESFFDRVLSFFGRENFTLEVVGQIEDCPQGKLANALENQMMDKFQTYRPDHGRGWNLGRAGVGFEFTVDDHKRYRRALIEIMQSEPVRQILRDRWNQPGEKARRAAILRASFNTDEARLNRSLSQKLRYQESGGMPEETRKKLSQSLQGNVPPNKGKEQPSTKGKNNPACRPEVRQKLKFKRTDETKEKMGAWQRGKPKSEEAKEAMKAAWLRRKMGNFIDVWEAVA